MNDLSGYRRSYEKSELLESEVPESPMELFSKWFREAEAAEPQGEVNAMTLSTIATDGFPSARVVLLKQFDQAGFTFFTNYNSEKGRAIAVNPKVCLSFFWHAIERQVIIKGVASKVGLELSDNYFNSRPEGSKLGALASNQSEAIPSRAFLEDRLAILTKEFEGKNIPRPEHWGGYIVEPVSIEFWQGRSNRLHDRLIFNLEESGWTMKRLAP